VTIVATRQGVSVATVYRARQRYLKTGSVDRAAGPIGWSHTQAPTLRKQSRSLILRCTATRYKLLCARSLMRTPAPGTTRKTRPNKNVDCPHSTLQSSKKCVHYAINAYLNYCNLLFIYSKKCAAVSFSRVLQKKLPNKFSKVQRTCTPPRRISFLGRIFFLPRVVSKKNCGPAIPVFTAERSGRSAGCSKARLLKVYVSFCSFALLWWSIELFKPRLLLLFSFERAFFFFQSFLSLLRLAYYVVLGKK